ncbi:hypothetical protein PoHVEF18_001753 [Penicillium ochrochloron]
MPETFDVEHVLANISDQDKIALLSGIDFWHTHPIPEFNVPSIRATDGPNGIRGTKFFAGIPAACLPCGTALGATWDRDLIYQAGELLGEECIAKGAHCWLGPTINMQRAPTGGRGFESFAEDPHLSGILAKSIILGCESKGVVSTVKHFVGNDQEHERRAVDVLVTQRALREIYLRPFQIVARDAKPGALMTSYNKINGKHVVEDARMLNLIREEWKWNPLVMSDWYGTYTTIDSMNAGLDLEMPGVSRYRGKYLESAMQARLIKQSTIDARARKVLEFVKQASRVQVSEEERGRDLPEDRALNRKICANSIVLLKNEGILPLPKQIKKIALIGSHMKTPAISGGGSASLEPYYSVSLYDACTEALPNAEVLYEAGAYAHRMLPVIDRLLSNAVIHFYNEPMGKERYLISTEPVSTTAFQFMDYYAPGLNRGIFWATLIGDFTPDASGIWDFGLSVFGTANLYIDDELVIDNTTSQTRGTAFFGKGTVEEPGWKELVAGTTYKIRIEFGSANTTTMKTVGMVNFGGGAASLGACLRMDRDEMIENAVKAATEADYTILCTGLNKDWESEGFDREHMDLPPGVDRLIVKVLQAAADKTVIVNQSGTPVTMPWADRAQCIVQAWYGGNETGHGISDVLFGEVNPCGKLPLSWPVDVKHNPAYLNYASVGGRVLYGEDIYAGYRFYEKTEREVLFPFGHGLSYTTFEVSPSVTIAPEIFNMECPSVATVQIKNTGKVAGAQILQLYISAPESPTPRPSKELHGFEKVFLQPGEEKTVDIQLDRYATSFWDEIEDMWKSEQGTYEVLIGTSSQEILARALPSLDPQRLLELREIFMTKIWTKNPIVEPDQLDFYIARVLENGIDWSASSCLVLLILALAAIWGNYPDDETRELSSNAPSFSPPLTYVSMSVPEHRMKESLTFLSMARKRISTAYLDDTLLGVQCLCLFGEVRYELTDLPPCDLSLSDFPYSLPSFPTRQPSENSPGWQFSNPSSIDLEAVSSYYYLAEIFLRRLLNRARNAVRVLSPDIDLPTIKVLAETLTQLEGQLQQWVDCLPHTLRFNMPLESAPGPKESELMKLSRERYVEVRELLCRAYLYLCIHVPLDPGMAALYGVKASEALLLAVYRIQTEVPFFRHPGSWGACRVRFNHALCLIAGFRAKLTHRPSAEYVTVPPDWADCVRVVIERLKIWGEEGGGIKELSVLLEWLMHGSLEL